MKKIIELDEGKIEAIKMIDSSDQTFIVGVANTCIVLGKEDDVLATFGVIVNALKDIGIKKQILMLILNYIYNMED